MIFVLYKLVCAKVKTMDYNISIQFGDRVSMAIYLKDEFTAQYITNSNIKVILEGTSALPIVKPDCYVFTGLNNKIYNVIIKSDNYLMEKFPVNMEELPSNKAIFFTLKPSPAYPFPEKSNIIRLSLIDSQEKAVEGANIEAAIVSEGSAAARIMSTEGENDIFNLVNISGGIGRGDIFEIKKKEGISAETCTIAGRIKNGKFKLTKPLADEQLKGGLLMPLIYTRTDSRGESVIYFRNFREKSCEVRLKIENEETERRILMEEGKPILLGKVQIVV